MKFVTELTNNMNNPFKWLLFIVVASTLIFSGWSVKDFEPALGRLLMSLGFVLAGFLLVFYAYKNLK